MIHMVMHCTKPCDTMRNLIMTPGIADALHRAPSKPQSRIDTSRPPASNPCSFAHPTATTVSEPGEVGTALAEKGQRPAGGPLGRRRCSTHQAEQQRKGPTLGAIAAHQTPAWAAPRPSRPCSATSRASSVKPPAARSQSEDGSATMP